MNGACRVAVTVNGTTEVREVQDRLLLVDFLRDHLELIGTHVGCEQGVCGACTVLIDGAPARSCLTLAVQADGCAVTTIEGLRSTPEWATLADAFHRHHALQCGFCTPGILVTLCGVEPGEYGDERAVRELLSGNVCRCTGYQHIVDAVCDVWGVPSAKEATA